MNTTKLKQTLINITVIKINPISFYISILILLWFKSLYNILGFTMKQSIYISHVSWISAIVDKKF